MADTFSNPAELAMAQLVEFLNQNGLGSNVLEPGGLAGISSSGFSPFLGQAQYARDRALRNQELLKNVQDASNRQQAFTNYASRGATAASAESQQMTRQVMGALFNNPTFSPFVGGSDIDLVFGIQNAAQASRFQAGGQKLYAGGPVTDQVTYDLWRKADNYFFSGGFNNLNRTSGFDRTQIGQVFSVMGSRGAFAGMEMGPNLDVNAASEKINKAVSDITRPLRMLQDIVGPKPMGELIALAESLSGISAGVKNAGQQIQATLSRAVETASSFNLDPHKYLNFQGSVIQGLTQMGFGGASAASFGNSISAYAQKVQMVSQASAANSSYFTPVTTAAQAAAGMMTNTAAAMQDPKMQAYLLGLLMQQNNMGSKADLARLAEVYSGGGGEDNLSRIFETVTSISGGNVRQAVHKFGGAAKLMEVVGPEGRSRFSGMVEETLMDRSVNQRLRANLRGQYAAIHRLTGSDQAANAAIELQVWASSTLSSENQQKIAGLLEGPDAKGALTAMLATDLGTKGLSEGDRAMRVQQLMSGARTWSAMRGYNDAYRGLDKRASPLAKADRIAMLKQELTGGRVLDDYTPSYTSPVGSFLGGIMGRDTVSDGQIITYAEIQKAAGRASDLLTFSYDAFRGGSKEEETNLRAIMAATGASTKDTDAMVKSLRGDEASAYGKMKELRHRMTSTGGAVRYEEGKIGAFSYVKKDEKKITAMQNASANLLLKSVMRAVAGDDDKALAEYRKKEANLEGTDIGQKMPAADEIKSITNSLLNHANSDFARKQGDRLLGHAGLKSTYIAELMAERKSNVATLDENREKYYTKDKEGKITGQLNDDGKKLQGRIDRADDLINSGTGGTFTGTLVIKNFMEAICKFTGMAMPGQPGDSSTAKP
jgi:hypothetical protein